MSSSQQHPSAVVPNHRTAQLLRRITPQTFTGDLTCQSYPTRPITPVARNVNMFLLHETTFVVSPSGSNNLQSGPFSSVIMQAFGKGEVLLDEQCLDVAWVRKHVAGITQGSASAQVFRGSVHRNVALGAVRSGRRVGDVSR